MDADVTPLEDLEVFEFSDAAEPVKFSTIFGLLKDDESFDPVAYLASIRA